MGKMGQFTLGRVDPLQPLGQRCCLLVAAGDRVSVIGGHGGGEKAGTIGTEDSGVEELGEVRGHEVFANIGSITG